MEQLLDHAEALGPLVRARRNELGVTQIELADIARTGVRFNFTTTRSTAWNDC